MLIFKTYCVVISKNIYINLTFFFLSLFLIKLCNTNVVLFLLASRFILIGVARERSAKRCSTCILVYFRSLSSTSVQMPRSFHTFTWPPVSLILCSRKSTEVSPCILFSYCLTFILFYKIVFDINRLIKYLIIKNIKTLGVFKF